MSDLGTLAAAVATRLGIEDSERAAVVIRHEIGASIRANEHRNLFWNVKEATITPLVVGQYIYAQGATSSDLPQDWLAPVAHPDAAGNATAWIATTADPDDLFEFEFVSPGTYRKLRARWTDRDDRPRAWTMIDESLYLVPSADVTTYTITLNYIYRASQSFSYVITSGAWAGSNDSYTDDWFDTEKGFHFLVDDVCQRVRRGYQKDLQGAQGFAMGAGEQLLSMTARAEKNEAPGRIRWHW